MLLHGGNGGDHDELPKSASVKGIAARQLLTEHFKRKPEKVLASVRERLAVARRKGSAAELEPRDMYLHFTETVPLRISQDTDAFGLPHRQDVGAFRTGRDRAPPCTGGSDRCLCRTSGVRLRRAATVSPTSCGLAPFQIPLLLQALNCLAGAGVGGSCVALFVNISEFLFAFPTG